MFGWLKRKSKDGLNSGKDFGKKVLNLEEAKKHWQDIGNMYDVLANPAKVKKSSVVKTFNQAVIENNLSPQDINQIYFNYSMSFYISLVLSLLCVASTMYSAVVGSFGGAIAGLAIWVVCIANMFRFSYNSFRIKHQKFCSVRDWWNNPNQWFPKIKN